MDEANVDRSTTLNPNHASLRADAKLNRLRIVEAAEAAFAEQGVNASMAEIARRADVGLATLFRRFPTKEALLCEVFADRVAACEAELTAALADPDPWRAFRSIVEGFCTAQVCARGLAAEIVATFLEGTGFAEERRMVERQVTFLIARAQASGALRHDVTYADFLILLKANAGVIALSGDVADEASRHLVATILRGFQADPGAALPESS